jgi:hypothetical protein
VEVLSPVAVARDVDPPDAAESEDRALDARGEGASSASGRSAKES